MTKKIVIDGRFWLESGIGRYIRNLIYELGEIDGGDESRKTNQTDEPYEYYILLLKKDFQKVNFSKNNFHKVLADFKWYGIAEQIKLPELLKKLKPDLVHFPHFNVPFFYKGKYVVTIHDLIHQHFQTREATTRSSFVYGIKKFGYRKVFGKAVKKSLKIITPSEFVKKQLQKEWGVKEKRVVVTYEGVDEELIGVIGEVGENDFKKVEKKFSIKKPYLFYVGNAQPHKNILGLIGAFREVREKYPSLSLVLAGPESFFWEKIKRESGNLGKSGEEGITFTGFLEEKEMVVLYKNAEGFVMPSLEEGFGIPILEAMACSCPVISSNAASLPEVGGEAAVYFDPRNISDMAEKISSVLGNKNLREELIKKGNKRYTEFSWEKMARETLKVYRGD